MKPPLLVTLGLLLAVSAAARAAEPPRPANFDELALRLAQTRQDMRALEDRLGRLEGLLNSQGLLGLLNQVNELKADLARLRGAQEEQGHVLQNLDGRQKQIYSELDMRLTDLANRAPAVAAPEGVHLQPAQTLAMVAAADPEAETRGYEAALNHFKAGDYKAAQSAFQNFLGRHPNADLASNAQYWLGLSYAAMGDYQNAAHSYQLLLKAYPSSNKVPDTLVSLARAQLQLGEADAARGLLEEVVTRYPTIKAAENARKLLATLK